MMTAAATDLAGIGSALSEAHMAAVAPTVALVPAAVDEVSGSSYGIGKALVTEDEDWDF